MGKRVNQAEIDAAVLDALDKGESWRSVAKRLGVSTSHISQLTKRRAHEQKGAPAPAGEAQQVKRGEALLVNEPPPPKGAPRAPAGPAGAAPPPPPAVGDPKPKPKGVRDVEWRF